MKHPSPFQLHLFMGRFSPCSTMREKDNANLLALSMHRSTYQHYSPYFCAFAIRASLPGTFVCCCCFCCCSSTCVVGWASAVAVSTLASYPPVEEMKHTCYIVLQLTNSFLPEISTIFSSCLTLKVFRKRSLFF